MRIKIGFFLLCYVIGLAGADFKSNMQPILTQACVLAGEYVRNRTQAIPVVAIAGCSAVGKSYFTHLIAHALREKGFNVFVLHQDDYLNMDKTFSGYKIHPNLNHDYLHEFLSKNRRGIKKITKPCKIDKKHMQNKELDLTRVDLILFEGIYALTCPETYNFVQYAHLGIFLDAHTTDIIAWHALRNKKRSFFQRHSDSVIKEHATCLLQEYIRYILPSRKNAQFVIYKDDLNSYRLLS
jgi:uridine kinase